MYTLLQGFPYLFISGCQQFKKACFDVELIKLYPYCISATRTVQYRRVHYNRLIADEIKKKYISLCINTWLKLV